MAHVWDATDEVLERRVAVKVLHDHLQTDERFVARFRAEGVAAARLTHRAIVSIYDQISEPDLEAIVMELIDGITMRAWLDENPHPPLEDACAVISTVAEALEAAHAMTLVHRDIKPSNILLADDGRVIVADFGIAKLASDPDLTATGATMGTARYLSPEQVRGDDVDGRSDIYSLAVVLYEALCGRAPFDGNNDMATALARLQGPPAPPRSINNAIPPALEAVVLRALTIDPDERFPDAAAFRHALQGALRAPPPPPATPPTTSTAIDPPKSFAESERSWLVPTLVLLFIVVGLGVAALLLSATTAGRDLLDSARGAVGVDTNTSREQRPPVPLGPERSIVGATSFDPQGSGPSPTEREDLIGNLLDGDPATYWQTEGYGTRSFGNLKRGVGVILELDRVTQVDAVHISSPTTGWATEIYVADAPKDSLAEWRFSGSTTGIDGDVTISDLDAEVGAILVWITDLGDGPARVRVRIGGIAVLGPVS